MLTLNTISSPGASKDRTRRGRGVSAGKGRTGGRGTKGQKARKSGNVRPGFEGGQTPLYRRLPKVGFKNTVGLLERAAINVADLERLDPAVAKEVTLESLKKAGLARRTDVRLSILGAGELTKAFTVKAHKITPSAKDKIEKAGGTVEVVAPPQSRPRGVKKPVQTTA